MKSRQLLEAMNDLPEDLIAEGKIRRRHPLLRVLAVAVCVLLVLSSLYPFFRDRIRGVSGDEDVPGVVIDGAAYEIRSAGSSTANQAGLPDTITADMAGMQVDELEEGTVHLYLPCENQRAVYILQRPDGTYRYLLFAGDQLSQDAWVEADQMFLTYGVTSAGELASLTWDGETIRDRQTLEAVYQALPQSDACGEAASRAELDDGQGAQPLTLEAAGGLRWTAGYSVSTGVLGWYGSYYAAGAGLLP